MSVTQPISVLIRRAAAGESAAHGELLAAVYTELKQLAAARLRSERSDHTLSPTALVHEAWIRMAVDADLAPSDRRQFFAAAARRMRQVLVDHARARLASKRDAGERDGAITLSSLAGGTPIDIDALALDQALSQLEAIDPRKARVVELRYFGGMEMVEISELLNISRATANRDWEVARAFLYQQLR